MLIITTLPAQHCSPGAEAATHGGKNRFECRTCPYQMVLDRRYFERKNMKLKAVEDILGGQDSWANVDRTDGEFGFVVVAAAGMMQGEAGGRVLGFVSVLSLVWFWLQGISLVMMLTSLPPFYSQVRQRILRLPRGLLPTSPDPQRRRAHDEFLQVLQVRHGLAGELIELLLSFDFLLFPNATAKNKNATEANSQSKVRKQLPPSKRTRLVTLLACAKGKPGTTNEHRCCHETQLPPTRGRLSHPALRGIK